MALIRPSADLRNKYNELSKICHQTNEPIFITKNGYNDLVILSDEAFNELKEEKIDKIIDEKFQKKYSEFEELKQDLLKNIKEALNEIEKGEYSSFEEFSKKMEAKYHING